MKTLKKNEEIKGKIVTFNSFRELLLDEFNKNFPEEYNDYVKIRSSATPETMNEAPQIETSTANPPAPDTVVVVKKEVL
jgi:hypothetical protein